MLLLLLRLLLRLPLLLVLPVLVLLCCTGLKQVRVVCSHNIIRILLSLIHVDVSACSWCWVSGQLPGSFP